MSTLTHLENTTPSRSWLRSEPGPEGAPLASGVPVLEMLVVDGVERPSGN
jgi:hypothetical protein